MVALILEHGVERAHEPQLVFFASLARIRFAHLQRSTFAERGEDFLFARCARGKTSRQGVRLPYAWVVPRSSCLGIRAFGFPVEFHVKLGKPSFLLPARRGQTKFKRFRRWQPSPTSMPLRQVAEVARKVARGAGKGTWRRSRATRRTVPRDNQRCPRLRRPGGAGCGQLDGGPAGSGLRGPSLAADVHALRRPEGSGIRAGKVACP